MVKLSAQSTILVLLFIYLLFIYLFIHLFTYLLFIYSLIYLFIYLYKNYHCHFYFTHTYMLWFHEPSTVQMVMPFTSWELKYSLVIIHT
jgi:hypothetical protein